MKHKLFLLISSLIILIFSAVTVVVVLKNKAKNTQNPVVALTTANQNIEELLFNESLKTRSFQPAKKTRIVLSQDFQKVTKDQIFFYDANQTPVDVSFEIIKEDETSKIEIAHSEQFKPGEYTLVIDDGAERQIAQDFSWGVLAVNTPKSVYSPNDKAEIFMTVLDKYGATACNAKVVLTIIAPSGKKTTFSTEKGSIEKSPECQPKNFTYLPDFKAIYAIPEEIGQYRLQLVSVIDDNPREIEEIMLVNPEEPYVITRTTATRIYPPSLYRQEIKILAKQDFQGQITEKIPSSFTVENSNSKDQTLSWSVNLKAGEEISLEYQYKAPLISPEFYLLGPLEFQQDTALIYTEPRSWHLAADPVSGLIVAWPSTAGTIPAGWSREAALDGRFLKSIISGSSNPGLTGGSTAPHTHTVTDHTHIQNSHTHSNSSGGATETNLYQTGTDYDLAARYHSHTVTIAGAVATNQNGSITLDSSSNEPPYYAVIWITSNGTTDIPDDAVAFGPSVLTNWTLSDGGGGRPDLRNKYLKGASTSADAGATGGSTSHTHTNSSHNHTQNSHGHPGSSTSQTTSWMEGDPGAWSLTTFSYLNHAHAVTVDSATAVNVAATAPMVSTANDPPYKKLLPLYNQSGGALLTDRVIAVWTGTVANIPENWHLCDGNDGTLDLRNYFVKGANDASENGNTGGGTVHTHTAIAHTHTQNAHGHTGSLGASNSNGYSPAAGNAGSASTHTHSLSVDNATAANQNTTVTVNNSADSRPHYYEVAFIQYISPPLPNVFRFEGLKMEGVKINYNLDFWRKMVNNLTQLAYIFYARKTEIIAYLT